MQYAMFTLSLPQCSPVEAAKLIKAAGYDGVEWRCAEQPSPLPPIPNCWGSNRATLDVNHWQAQAVEFRRRGHLRRLFQTAAAMWPESRGSFGETTSGGRVWATWEASKLQA